MIFSPIMKSQSEPQVKFAYNLFMELRRYEHPANHYDQNYLRDDTIIKQVRLNKNSKEILKRFIRLYRSLELSNQTQMIAIRGNLNRSGLKDFIKYVDKWKIQKFYLWSNAEPQILKIISHIEFSSLKQMYLGKNQIETIQKLNYAIMPFLEELDLRDNKICSIKSLAKCNFPLLKILCLNGNCVSNLQCGKLNFVKLKEFKINKMNFVRDIESIFKLECCESLSVMRLKTVENISLKEKVFSNRKNKFRKLKNWSSN